jgi:ATP-dependent Clp protease ATP-binding subunit ClpA
MIERMSPQGKAALNRAAEEARLLGHSKVGIEHLLLALFFIQESAYAVLVIVGVTGTKLQVFASPYNSAASERYASDHPHTIGVTEVGAQAFSEARQQGRLVDDLDLLKALARSPAGKAMLESFGISADAVLEVTEHVQHAQI